MNPEKVMQAITDYQEIESRYSGRLGWRNYWRIYRHTSSPYGGKDAICICDTELRPEVKKALADTFPLPATYSLQLNGHNVIYGTLEEVAALWNAIND